MSKAHLSPCPSCSRHVRVSESSCPHCGVSTTDEFRSRSAPALPGRRLKRAALFAVGIGTAAVGAVACTDDLIVGDDDGCVKDYCSDSPAYGIAIDAAEPVPDGNDASDSAVASEASPDAEADSALIDAASDGPFPDSSM